MSKKSRRGDNSKRPQPMVQQRAQAHQPNRATQAKNADKSAKESSRESQGGSRKE
jgi:hypothetical protein